MDILKTLKERGNELYLDELDFYVTELETGDYSTSYVSQCLRLIKSIKKWKTSQNNPVKKTKENKNSFGNILLNPSDLIVGYQDPKKEAMSIQELIKYEITEIRKKQDYNSLFKNYVLENNSLDENLIDQLFKFFMSWELEELLSLKTFSESFLEKYFVDLNHGKIAKYQYFSEEFFMKHFNDLNYNTVLQKGVNEWRKKANRSNKLDVFLRLKGVTI